MWRVCGAINKSVSIQELYHDYSHNIIQMACRVVAADPTKPGIFYVRELFPLIRHPMEHLRYLINVMLLPTLLFEIRSDKLR